MENIKIVEKRLVFFSIIILIGLGVSSMLIYTEFQNSIELSKQEKIGLNVLSQLDKFNSSITYIERNEKPELIAINKNNIIEIQQGFILASTALDSLKKIQFQSEIFPYEIDSLTNFIKNKNRLSEYVIKLSLNDNPDSANKILKNSNDMMINTSCQP